MSTKYLTKRVYESDREGKIVKGGTCARRLGFVQCKVAENEGHEGEVQRQNASK